MKVVRFIAWASRLGNFVKILEAYAALSVFLGVFIAYGSLTDRPSIRLVPSLPIAVVDLKGLSRASVKRGLPPLVDLEALRSEHGMSVAAIYGPDGRERAEVHLSAENYPLTHGAGPVFIYHYLKGNSVKESQAMYREIAQRSKSFEETARQIPKDDIQRTRIRLGIAESNDDPKVHPLRRERSPISMGAFLWWDLGVAEAFPQGNKEEFFRDIIDSRIQSLSSDQHSAAYSALAEARVATIQAIEIRNEGALGASEVEISVHTPPQSDVKISEEALLRQGIQISPVGKSHWRVTIPALASGKSRFIPLVGKENVGTPDLIEVVGSRGERPNRAKIFLTLALLGLVVLFLAMAEFCRSESKSTGEPISDGERRLNAGKSVDNPSTKVPIVVWGAALIALVLVTVRKSHSNSGI